MFALWPWGQSQVSAAIALMPSEEQDLSFIIKSLQKIEKLSNLNTGDKKLKKLLGWKIINSSIKNINIFAYQL